MLPWHVNLYAEAGVAEYWIVDPADRHITFLVLRDGAFVVQSPAAGKWHSRTLPEVELDVDGLWAAVEKEFGPLD